MKKYPDPRITKTTVIITLHEPIYGSYFGIWDKWLKIAKGKNLIVRSPFGIATYKVSEWKRGAKRLERYFKNPNVPMIFYARSIQPDIAARLERKKQEEREKLSIMGSLPRLSHSKIQQLKKIVLGI